METPVSRRDTIAALAVGLTATALGCTPQKPPSAEVAQPAQTPTAPAPEPDYSLHAGVKDLHVPEVVTIVGCGGFGAWPALFAALAGVKQLNLIDMADVDALDLARAPFAPQDVGKPKSDALKNVIAYLRPGAHVTSTKKRVSTSDLSLLQGTVFDGTNDMDLARNLPGLLQKNGQTYVTGFYGGNKVGVATGFTPDLEFESGRSVPVWIGNAAMSGALGVMAAFVKPFTFIGNPVELNQSPAVIAKAVRDFGTKDAAK